MEMQLSELPIRPVDHLPALGAADDQAIAGKAGALSYAELSQAVGRLAGWLAGLGLAPGARVASWVAKGQVACLMPLAAARAGMIHVPVNPLLERAQVAHILADSGAALMVGNRRAGVILGVILLPLSIPILIFGASATTRIETIQNPVELLILSGIALILTPISIWLSARLLKWSLG